LGQTPTTSVRRLIKKPARIGSRCYVAAVSQQGSTAQDIAQRAQEFKLVFLGFSAVVPQLVDPHLPLLRWELFRGGSPLDGDYPILVNDQPGGPGIAYSARETFTKLATVRGDVLRHDLLSIAMVQAAIRLGDMVTTCVPWSQRKDQPLLEFARHYRNACAHGDRWHFARDEPRNPAACRDLVITSGLQGRKATYQTVAPRHHIEFLDDLANYFVPGYVPPPAEERTHPT
jgi:hypothetical protein